MSAHFKDIKQCFPKSGPRTFFGSQEFQNWSARIKTYYFYKKRCPKMYNFSTTNHKTLLIKGSLDYHVVLIKYKLLFCGPQNFFKVFCGPQA
jgi:hypothetical protein